MPDLTLQSGRSVLENSIVNTLLLALGVRNWTVADIPSLRGIATLSPSGSGESLRDVNDLAFVSSIAPSGITYQWNPTATNGDDAVNFIKPTDLAAGLPGRWALTASSVPSGYLKRCQLYNDESTDEAMVERIFALQPAILVSFESATHTPKSKVPGALYWYEAHFNILVIATDMRGAQAARQGSAIGTEAVSNPGTAAMLGDVKAQLAGYDLGLNDVAYIEIGDETPVAQYAAQRRFVEELKITVYATLTNAGAAPTALGDPYEFNLQEELAGNPSQLAAPPLVLLGPTPPPSPSGNNPFDANNYVSSGVQCPLGDGLTQTIAAGSAYLAGVLVSPAATAHTFTANKATYRDLNPNGTYTFIETAIGVNPPPITLGALRVGVTITDASGVRVDQFLCDSLVSFGPMNKVEAPQLVSIAITPSPASVPHGSNFQFAATGTYSDGSTQDLTFGGLTWFSSNGAVATMTNYGQAINTNAGTTQITAALGAVVSLAVTLTVT